MSEERQGVIQIEDALQNSERHFRAVWENASDAMALSTPDGTVFAANPAYFRLYGYSPEEIIGKNYAIIFPEEYRPSAQELYAHIFQSPIISPSFETMVRRADGTERFVESSYNFITDEGTRIAMISIVRDITDRKLMEEELRISQMKLHLALEVGRMGSWDWDIEANTVQWSANLAVVLGLAPGHSSVRYETFLEFVHPEDRTLVDQGIKHALEEGDDYILEFRVVLPDGTIRKTRTHGEVLSDDEGKPVRMIGICRDVTNARAA